MRKCNKKFCKKAKFNVKNEVINNLINETKVNPNTSFAKNYEIATWSQIKKTIKSNLFTVGGHSLNHDIFSKLSKKNQEKNITESIKILRKKLNYKINFFSYPEGQKDHFDKHTINILKKNKIICSPTAIFGRNSHLTNPFFLKRVMVGFNEIKLPKFD